MLQITPLPLLKDNYAYFLEEISSGITALVDPSEADPVLEWLRAQGKTLTYILNTHHHWDHVGGNLEIQKATNALVVGYAHDQGRLPGQTLFLEEDALLPLGNTYARILFIPGHTLGHIAYFFEEDKAVFTGDTLFSLGCGRLFEGTPAQMWASLQKLSALPDDTRVYCGHEYTLANLAFAKQVHPQDRELCQQEERLRALVAKGRPTLPSTIAFEKRFNPFLRCAQDAVPPQEPVRLFQKRRATKDVF